MDKYGEASNTDNPGVQAARFTQRAAHSTKNATKKALHKRRIKGQYARQFRSNTVKQARFGAKYAKRSFRKVLSAIKQSVKLVLGRGKIIAFVIAVIVLLSLAMSGLSAIVSMFGGSFNVALLSTYTSEDEEMLGVHADYTAMENALAAQVGRVEDDYPGYDEYRYFIDVIGHDPYVLISYLSARYFAFTRTQAQGDLADLFRLQYSLTLTPIVEMRTRIETRTRIIIVIDGETGEEIEEEEEYEVEVEYEYHILEVHLKNTSLAMVVFQRLSEDEPEMYSIYMGTLGNRPDLFEDNPFASRAEYLRYEIPPEALEDEVFARMIAEAEKYLGWPYVWGGSSPASSFDCSGFVSWVINNTGWSVGRLGAIGLYNTCTIISPSEARPGDLVFFNHTYAAPQPHLATHVGIYAGNGMMIHAGNPISYVSIHTPYWTRHFMAFGRLPEPNY